MRRRTIFWTIAVFGIIGTIYGAYLLIYHYRHGNGIFIPSLVLLICGFVALVLFLSLYIATFFAQKKKKDEPNSPTEELDNKEEIVEPIVEEEKPTPTTKPEPAKEQEEYECVPKAERISDARPSYSVSTVYVKQVGYGPVLRVEGSRIVDMRTNTYYRLENNMVMEEGYGPAFEIRGNQIKDAFGSYLYEINGSNINKVYGGFYASVSGNYITLFDSSMKYEMTDSLSKRQMLVVVVLLFGKY